MGVLVSYTMHSPAYCVWDTEKQKVYDVAAPAFDEAAPPGWWRAPLNAAAGADADADYEEPLVFPATPPPPADTNASVPAVPEGPPADGAPPGDEITSAVPAPAVASDAVPVPAQAPAGVPPPAVPAPAPA